MKSSDQTRKAILAIILLFIGMSVLMGQEPGRIPRHKAMYHKLNPPDAPLPPDAPDPPAAPESLKMRHAGHPDLPGLTEDQQNKMREANLEHLKQMIPLRNQLKEIKARLNTILSTQPFDNKAADQAAEETGKLETSILKEKIRHHQAIRSLLNAEQQVIFDARPKPFLKKNFR